MALRNRYHRYGLGAAFGPRRAFSDLWAEPRGGISRKERTGAAGRGPLPGLALCSKEADEAAAWTWSPHPRRPGLCEVQS